ncbi:hypothetical protein P280DRAFT_286468 [Massarina eburnea CBS 473.64]|uniref:Uncharacterized protein n=1 Tax=Massarina eburnea CBS 473.64 TaxID=1395130 RepID=A0A6A6S1V7_9PLEO|nr:hypothetical protein P280DRAFT_286468 [Massarina eburnea CBS 473.64]
MFFYLDKMNAVTRLQHNKKLHTKLIDNSKRQGKSAFTISPKYPQSGRIYAPRGSIPTHYSHSSHRLYRDLIIFIQRNPSRAPIDIITGAHLPVQATPQPATRTASKDRPTLRDSMRPRSRFMQSDQQYRSSGKPFFCEICRFVKAPSMEAKTGCSGTKKEQSMHSDSDFEYM